MLFGDQTQMNVAFPPVTETRIPLSIFVVMGRKTPMTNLLILGHTCVSFCTTAISKSITIIPSRCFEKVSFVLRL